MAGFIVRGVPASMQRDAWWMAPDRGAGASTGAPVQPTNIWHLTALAGLIVAADLLVWGILPRAGLVAIALLIAAAASAFLPPVGQRNKIIAWGGLTLGLLPSLEEMQALSVLFAALGLCHFVGWSIWGDRPATLSRAIRAGLRFPAAALMRAGFDIAATPAALRHQVAPQLSIGRLLRDWALPLGLGAVFVLLLLIANPVLENWLNDLAMWNPAIPITGARLLFWLALAALIWPFLRLVYLHKKLCDESAVVARGLTLPAALLNARSVWRALLIFNLIFAVQTAMDATFLWGGASLPAGMTHAAYAHRGAYPLLATALLAGGFAVIAQPFLPGRPMLRALLYLWIAQNVALVLSSIMRLDLYVDSFGLTRLRFAAFVWMALVAAGLALMIAQLARGKTVGWLFGGAASLSLATLYVCCFVNVAGLVAGYNLSRPGLAQDPAYLCGLGEGAAVEIFAHEAKTRRPVCVYQLYPDVETPRNWREWGYRNWRLRHNLAALEAALIEGPRP